MILKELAMTAGVHAKTSALVGFGCDCHMSKQGSLGQALEDDELVLSYYGWFEPLIWALCDHLKVHSRMSSLTPSTFLPNWEEDAIPGLR